MTHFTTAVLRSITWRAVLATQALGFVFALTPWLEQFGQPTRPQLAFALTQQALTAFFVLLAALAGDEAVRRGWRVLAAFAATLLCASAATAYTQWCIEAWFGVIDPLHGERRLWDTFFQVGSLWGTVLLVYLNRQSAARLLARLRAGELARVQAERRLIASELAAAEAEINPTAVLQQLAQVRDLYATGDADADQKLEDLIGDLRAVVTRLQREMRA